MIIHGFPLVFLAVFSLKNPRLFPKVLVQPGLGGCEETPGGSHGF